MNLVGDLQTIRKDCNEQTVAVRAPHNKNAGLIDLLAEAKLDRYPLRSRTVGSSLPFSGLSFFMPHTYIHSPDEQSLSILRSRS
jgi:hypothetical protein